MKRFTVPCKFGDTSAPFDIYIGKAAGDEHPLSYQNTWLLERRGATIPTEVMDSFQKLADIAKQNDVSFEDLCVYALANANGPGTAEHAAAMKGRQGENKTEQENFTKVKEIAAAEELRDLFEDDFALLHIQYKNQQNEVYQAILLTKVERVQPLTSSILTGTFQVDSFPEYGIVEHLARGTEIAPTDLRKIFLKYKIPKNHFAANQH